MSQDNIPTENVPVSTVDWIDLYDRRPAKEDANTEGDVLVWWDKGGYSTWEPWDQIPPGGTDYPSHWARFPFRT